MASGAASLFDLLIVGGGPAGLAAALAAARACRAVLLLDGDDPRNAVAQRIHTYLNCDGTPPGEFRRLGREQVLRYRTVAYHRGSVAEISGSIGSFTAHLREGGVFNAKRVLLAVGVLDELPPIAGMDIYWGNGRGIYHCPYCDGYEHRDVPWGVVAHDQSSFDYAVFLTGWSQQITLFSQGLIAPSSVLSRLHAANVRLETGRIVRVHGGDAGIEYIELEEGRSIQVGALWIHPRHSQTALVKQLGLELNEEGSIARNEQGETSERGIYAAGDLSAGPLHQAILAAADGTRVAYAINHDVIMEPYYQSERGWLTDTALGQSFVCP